MIDRAAEGLSGRKSVGSENVRISFDAALTRYKSTPGSWPATLPFIRVGAAHGEHLFNEIARAIISADSAISTPVIAIRT